LRTSFSDEESERRFQQTFHQESLKNMGVITICTFITATINLFLFIRLVYFSPYGQMPVIKSEGVNSIILNSVWVVYSIVAYMLHRLGF
jgi:ABC-type phosphate transport system permease subunit